MKQEQLRKHFVEAMAKHLPPSASQLRLLDLEGCCGAYLQELREDLAIQVVSAHELRQRQLPPFSIDAVISHDLDLHQSLLAGALNALRPGGRFIAVQSTGSPSEDWLRLLESNGYVRILVEAAADGMGVLIRGEKAHTSRDTLRLIAAVADADANLLDIKSYRGRFVHLLIRQSPNKPVWNMAADEKVSWRALALRDTEGSLLLGFSSLPKAVGFMQKMVLAGHSNDVNKVGKFSVSTAAAWQWDVKLNPAPDIVQNHFKIWLDIDPATAEASDE